MQSSHSKNSETLMGEVEQLQTLKERSIVVLRKTGLKSAIN